MQNIRGMIFDLPQRQVGAVQRLGLGAQPHEQMALAAGLGAGEKQVAPGFAMGQLVQLIEELGIAAGDEIGQGDLR